jgi:hypothetical protein
MDGIPPRELYWRLAGVNYLGWRVRRADFLTIENSFSPNRLRPSIVPGVSNYRAVQFCGATSVRRTPTVHFGTMT